MTRGPEKSARANLKKASSTICMGARALATWHNKSNVSRGKTVVFIYLTEGVKGKMSMKVGNEMLGT